MECKSSEKPRRFADFSKDLAKHVGLRDRFTRAVRDQFPSPNKRPSIFAIWSSGITASENDLRRADADHVSLLDETDLKYYEQLVGQVGAAARFQFLADLLGGRTVPGLELTVPAIRSKIAGGVAYSFCVSPEFHHADRRLLQRHIQSNIVHHCRSPSLQGHIKMASCVSGELIPYAFTWHDPGITPCCKTIFTTKLSNIDSRTSIVAQHRLNEAADAAVKERSQ
jgi:hypothetical protein